MNSEDITGYFDNNFHRDMPLTELDSLYEEGHDLTGFKSWIVNIAAEYKPNRGDLYLDLLYRDYLFIQRMEEKEDEKE